MQDKITIEILWQAHVGLEQGSDVLARKLVKIVMYQPRKKTIFRGYGSTTEPHRTARKQEDICILLARTKIEFCTFSIGF